MVKKNIDTDLPDDIDLSSRKRNKQYLNIDYSKMEYIDFSKSLYEKFSVNSSLTYNIRIPSYLVPALRNYNGTEFEGLIALVIEGVSDLFYQKVATNFCVSVFNMGIKSLNLPESLLMHSDIHENTRSYDILKEVMSSYDDFSKFFFVDVNSRFSSHMSDRLERAAIDINNLLTAEKLKVKELQDKVNTLTISYNKQIEDLNQKYNNLVNFRSSHVSDLERNIKDYQGVISNLQAKIKDNDNYRYYHFSIPRFDRILRIKLISFIHKIKATISRVKK